MCVREGQSSDIFGACRIINFYHFIHYELMHNVFFEEVYVRENKKKQKDCSVGPKNNKISITSMIFFRKQKEDRNFFKIFLAWKNKIVRNFFECICEFNMRFFFWRFLYKNDMTLGHISYVVNLVKRKKEIFMFTFIPVYIFFWMNINFPFFACKCPSDLIYSWLFMVNFRHNMYDRNL